MLLLIRQNGTARKMSYKALAEHFSSWNATEYSIRHALRKAGCTQGRARARRPTVRKHGMWDKGMDSMYGSLRRGSDNALQIIHLALFNRIRVRTFQSPSSAIRL